MATLLYISGQRFVCHCEVSAKGDGGVMCTYDKPEEGSVFEIIPDLLTTKLCHQDPLPNLSEPARLYL